jgi:hypothetical protein
MGCVALSLWIYFLYHRVQKGTDENYPLEGSLLGVQATFMRLMPSAGYSLLIIPLNLVYQKLAIFMTNFGTKIYMKILKDRSVFFRKSSTSISI